MSDARPVKERETPAATAAAPLRARAAAPGWPEELPFPGVAVELGGNRPVVLDDTGVWLVERGDVDVFSVLLAGDQPIGPRRHLLRAGGRRIVLGVARAERGRGLIAVGMNGSRLVRASWAELGALLEAPRLAERARSLVEDCVEQHCQAMAPVRQAAAGPGAPQPVSFLGGDAAAACEGLRRLADSLRAHVEQAADADERAGLERARVRSAESQATVGRALARLAGMMSPGGRRRGAEAPDFAAEEPLMACCRVVGDTLGVAIKAPPEGGPAGRDPLATIVRSSRLQARQVALRNQWWRSEKGPLVAFAAEGKRPLALTWRAGRYLVHDPSAPPGSAPAPLDAARAAALSPFAYTIYRPFPEIPVGVRDLLQFAVRGCGRDFAWIGLIALLATLLAMVPPVATSLLFDSVIPGVQRAQLWQMTLLLIACGVSAVGFSIFQGLVVVRLQQRTGNAVQAAVWDRLIRLPLRFFRPYTAGDLAQRAMSIDAIQQVLSGVTIVAILNGLASLGSLALMFAISTPMAWRAISLIALAIAVTTVAGAVNGRRQRAMVKLRAKTSGLVLQLLTSISKLRVAGAEVRAFGQWAERFTAQRQLQFKMQIIVGWVRAFTAAFPVIASVLIFIEAVPALGGPGALRTGDVLAFAAAFTASLQALLTTCSALVQALDVVSLYDQASPILHALPEACAGRYDPGKLTGEIEIQHAVFRYAEDGPPILRDVSIHVRPGEFVAMVGASGSGKSTILKLLLGFEQPESGSVFYDGQEIRGLDIVEVRRQMGVVLQSSRLVAGDIFTNIVGSSPATMKQAWEAAALAGIADDIQAMPMKMHTMISEGAGTLAGGQRQRLLIARAIVNCPRILLFDEATSALDNRTQALVTASLEKLNAARIVVAHRLSTIANADRIYVMESGRVVQCGTFAELLKEKGVFAELARRQLV